MTTLPLKEYLDQIDALLDENQHDSVIGHCYHILKRHPRHVDTYRLLAKGLLGAGRTEEAAEIFQRILSTDPNDLIAHIALSDIAQTDGNSDVALYHLERAFELDPYNGAIQEELNRHYETSGDLGSTRIQLNEGGLARLYVRGELYDQATRLLEESIAKDASRIDLEVVLAEALWREGNRVEAAEVSLKVLDNLPNSIVANAVLTDIWFGSGRISDAKKHAKNLQSMVLADKRNINRESVVSAALMAEEAPPLPELFEIEALEEVRAADVAVTMQEMSSVDEALLQQDMESDVGDMYDWLSGVVKPSAEARMEEVLEPDSWPMGDESVVDSDWFLEEAEDEPDSVGAIDADLVEADSGEDAVDIDPIEQINQNEDLADAFVLEFNEQAKSSADLPDWISAEEESLDLDALSSNLPSQMEELPDWLSEAASEDFEPIVMDSATASQWLLDDQQANAADSDEREALPENVQDTQDWLADLTQEFSEITNEEPAEWLSESSVEERKDETDWFADFVADDPPQETETVDAPNEAEDWLNDERLSDETALQSSELSSESDDSDMWLHEEQNVASPMNEKDQDPKKKKPTPSDEQEQSSDVNDWLADLTSGDAEEDFDWFEELEGASSAAADDESNVDAYGSEQFDDLLANLDDESDGLFSEDALLDATADDSFEDIDQWLNDLSKSEEENSEDWLSNLVDEEPPDNVGFTDWLNSQVVEQDVELTSEADAVVQSTAVDDTAVDDSVPDFLAEDGTGDITGLTDLLEEAQEEGLTDLLADEPIEAEAEQSDELFDLFADSTDFADDEAEETSDELFAESDEFLSDEAETEEESIEDLFAQLENRSPDDVVEETDIFDLMGEEGLTDLLGDAGMVEADQESSGLTDLLDDIDEEVTPETAADTSLTDLLGQVDSETEMAQQSEQADWLSDSADDLSALVEEVDADSVADQADEWLAMIDDSGEEDGLADLLDETEIEAETGLTDLLDETAVDDSYAGLTDLLADANEPLDERMGLVEEEGSGIFDVPDGDGLADLLADGDEEEQSLTDLLEEIDGDLLIDEEDELGYLALANADEGGLTDLLADDDEKTDHESRMPDTAELEEMLAHEGSEDALDAIDTNLPDWLGDAQGAEMLEDEPALDWLDDTGDLEGLEEEIAPQTTGLLRKLDDLPGIKAAIEESSQQVEEEPDEEPEEAAFEPTMTDFLTSSEDTAWLDQLAEQDQQGQPNLDWMEDTPPEPTLDWLDTGVLAEEDGALEEALPVDEPESEVEEEFDSTPSDLDDAMSWLDEMVIEEQTPIEPLPTVAEVLDDETDPEPETIGTADEVQEALLPEEDFEFDEYIVADEPLDELAELELEDQTADESLEDLLRLDFEEESDDELTIASTAEPETSDDELSEALSEIDDAMAWLDELDNEADVLEAEAAPITNEAEAALDELDISNEDEIDDAMAWLEQLAAKQGAPLDELPSVSEKTTVVTPPSDDDELEQAEEELDAELTEALAWLESVALDEEMVVHHEMSIPQTTDAELAETLDWLEKIALNGDAPRHVEKTVDKSEAVDEFQTVVTTPPVAEEMAVDEEDLFAAVFDIPDDQDAAMAWLEEIDDDDEDERLDEDSALFDEDSEIQIDSADSLEETAVFPEEMITTEDAVDDLPLGTEDTAAADDNIELDNDTSDDIESFMDGIFDIPDDPDAAMAWLEEAADENDAPLWVEDDLQPDEVAPAAVDVAATSDDSEEDDTGGDDLDSDLFESVPEDPDAAMAWLERLAAKQGAPLAELPSVDEPVEDVETPEWIASQLAEVADTVEEEPDSDGFTFGQRPVLPELADEEGQSPPNQDPQNVNISVQTDELEEDIEADDLPEGLPDWFSLDSIDDEMEEIPSQTDWLDSIPELGGTAWLTSESEAASIHSDSVDIIPDTGPLIDSALSGTGPLPDIDPVPAEPEPIESSEEDLDSIIEEPDSSVYRVNRDRLNEAKMAVEQQAYSSAVEAFQSLIAEGNGLMLLIGELEIISEEHPDEPAFRRLLGDAYMRNGQLQKALLTYREALDQL